MKRRTLYFIAIIVACAAITAAFLIRQTYLYLIGQAPIKLTAQTYNEKTLGVKPSSFPIYTSVTDIGYYRIPLTKSDFDAAFRSGYSFSQFHRSVRAPVWWQPPSDSPFQFQREDKDHEFAYIYDESHETLYQTHHWKQHSALGTSE
jgi:hypothetical protein